MIIRHTVVAPLAITLDGTKAMPLRRRRKEAHQHGKDDGFRKAGGTTRVGQRHGRIPVHNLAQLICRSHGLQSQNLLPHMGETEDLMATSLQARLHTVQSAQQLVVSIGKNQLRPCDLNTVDKCLGWEVGVDQRGGGADGQESHPSAEHVRRVDHENGDKVARLDTLRQEPLGVLVDAGVGLVVGEAFGVGPESFRRAIALDRVFEVVVYGDTTAISCW